MAISPEAVLAERDTKTQAEVEGCVTRIDEEIRRNWDGANEVQIGAFLNKGNAITELVLASYREAGWKVSFRQAGPLYPKHYSLRAIPEEGV